MDRLYWFREMRYGGIPFGPYANRNHFAGFRGTCYYPWHWFPWPSERSAANAGCRWLVCHHAHRRIDHVRFPRGNHRRRSAAHALGSLDGSAENGRQAAPGWRRAVIGCIAHGRLAWRQENSGSLFFLANPGSVAIQAHLHAPGTPCESFVIIPGPVLV